MLRPINRATRGNLMEMPSLWDMYRYYNKYQDFKHRIRQPERDFVGDKMAPQSSVEYARFGTAMAKQGLRRHLPKKPVTALANLNTKKPLPHISRAGKVAGAFGTLGKAGVLASAGGLDRVKRGFDERMSMYESEEEAQSQPSPRRNATSRISSTSSMGDRGPGSPVGKLRPTGGLYKQPKPDTIQGPRRAKIERPDQPKGPKSWEGQQQSPQQPSPEEAAQAALQTRTQEFRNRLAGITMVPQPKSRTASPASPNTRVGTRESDGGPKWPKTEKAVQRFLKSKADIRLRRGTPVKHTFRSNDGLHQYSGRPLSMRQKMLAEHRRKQFALPTNFENLSPQDIGYAFDRLSDRGMLEDRTNLDPSHLNYFRRRVTRVGGRLGRRVKKFLGGLVTRKGDGKKSVKESDGTPPLIEATAPFCQFSVGNVMYPEECGCNECSQLIETSGTSFGQNIRDGNSNIGEAEIYEDIQKKRLAISRLLSKRKRKKRRRMSESQVNLNQTLARDLMLHNRYPEPRSLTRRPGTYFQGAHTLRKLDRLGMFLAKTAIVANGLAPAARSFMWQYKDRFPTFMRDAKHAADNIKATVVGRAVRESGYTERLSRMGDNYGRRFPRIREFVDAPLSTAKSAVEWAGVRGVEKLADKLKYDKLKTHAYPIGKAAGYGAGLAGMYAAKKLIYNPLKRKYQQYRNRRNDDDRYGRFTYHEF